MISVNLISRILARYKTVKSTKTGIKKQFWLTLIIFFLE